jgi:hypothetical protein
MTAHTAVEHHDLDRSECWCCGMLDDPRRMIRLGNHPEVLLCVRCGRWAGKQAWEIEDSARTGVAVVLRDRVRDVRRAVVRRGWHHGRIAGGPLRWLGKRLP